MKTYEARRTSQVAIVLDCTTGIRLVPGVRIAVYGRRLIPLAGIILGPLPTHDARKQGFLIRAYLNLKIAIYGDSSPLNFYSNPMV